MTQQIQLDAVAYHKQMEEIALRRIELVATSPLVDPQLLAVARTLLQQAFAMLNAATLNEPRVALVGDDPAHPYAPPPTAAQAVGAQQTSPYIQAAPVQSSPLEHPLPPSTPSVMDMSKEAVQTALDRDSRVE